MHTALDCYLHIIDLDDGTLYAVVQLMTVCVVCSLSIKAHTDSSE